MLQPITQRTGFGQADAFAVGQGSKAPGRMRGQSLENTLGLAVATIPILAHAFLEGPATEEQERTDRQQ